MQEDLAGLFMRQMSMDGAHQTALTTRPLSPSTPKPTQDVVPPIVYSITQHYHHSSHIATNPTSPNPAQQQQLLDRPEPEIPPGVPAENVLMQHGIDPWTLFPSQLTLFKQADPGQQSRLITLWQISPPGYGNKQPVAQELGTGGTGGGGGCGDGGGDSMMAMDEDMSENIDNNDAEPYVISGYESLAQREYDMSAAGRQTEPQIPPAEPSTGSQYKLANDPAYRSREWWNHSNSGQQQRQQQQQQMEQQYGAFQQTNGYGNGYGYANCGIAQTRGHWMDEDEQML